MEHDIVGEFAQYLRLRLTRGAFLAAWGDIDIDVSIARRAGAALFSGEGLFMTTLRGPGTVPLQSIKRGAQATPRPRR